MYLLSALLALALIAVYRLRFGSGPYGARPQAVLSLVAALILLPAAVGVAQPEPERHAAPVSLAIAVDLSLSMDAAPDPRIAPDTGTRLQRAQRVLLPVLARLEASGARVLAAVSVFTTRSQTLLAWERSLPPVREVIEHVLDTGLAAEHGTDLAAALEGAVTLFEALPEAAEAPGGKRFLLVVSDGEQTETPLSVGSELSRLHDLGVKTIALHVGSRDVPEGVHVYGAQNRFLGFDRVGGRVHSIPDAGNMRLIAGQRASAGLFTAPDQENSVSSILRFVDVPPIETPASAGHLALTWSLWVLVLVALGRLV